MFCRRPCKSLVKGEKDSPDARFRRSAHCRTCQNLQLTRVPLGGGSCLRRTGHPFTVSGPCGPSQKIECVFSASPETVRREPREFHLRCSVGQWRDLAVCALCDPGAFPFVGLVFRPRRICNLLQARNPVVLDPRREDMRPSCALPQASLDWRSLSVSLFHRATQDRDPVGAPTSPPRSAQIGYSCCAVWKSVCESTSRLSFFHHRRDRNN